MDFTNLYVDVDDFWQAFRGAYEQRLLTQGKRQRRRATRLSVSEIMTIMTPFQTSNFRTFKQF